jgi:phospholipid/cholesterol/gamma-HCH transport system permease protein
MTWRGTPSPLRPKLTPRLRRWADGWNQLGVQTAFYVKSMRAIGGAFVRYKEETARVVAQMSMGVGALALVGGAVVIVSFLVLNAGSIIGLVGYPQLNQIGIQALAGFLSAYINPRLATPLIVAVGLAATIGAGSTAQLGAMRINEEIDALEVMGISTITYLVSTRVVAGVIVVIPLFFLSLLAGFVGTWAVVVVSYGQSSGGYDHYFDTFLRSTDIIWALLQVMLQGLVIMLIHTYYGFNASGGPAGVGEATGRAVRTSLVATVFVTLVVALAIYGRSGDFHLSG